MSFETLHEVKIDKSILENNLMDVRLQIVDIRDHEYANTKSKIITFLIDSVPEFGKKVVVKFKDEPDEKREDNSVIPKGRTQLANVIISAGFGELNDKNEANTPENFDFKLLLGRYIEANIKVGPYYHYLAKIRKVLPHDVN